MLQNPMQYIALEEVHAVDANPNASLLEPVQSAGDKLERVTENLLAEVGQNAVESK